MDKRQYFIEALQAGAFKHKTWILSMFAVIRKPVSSTAPYEVVYNEDAKDQTVYFKDPNNNDELTPIDGSNRTQPLFTFNELVHLDPGDLPNVNEKIVTIYGNVLFNAMAVCWPFGDKIPFVQGEVDGHKFETLIANRLHDDPDQLPVELNTQLWGGVVRDGDKLFVHELLRYCEAMAAIAGLTQLNAPAASPKSMTVNPEILKRRDELLKEYKDQLHDPAIIAKIEDELVSMDKAWFKGDPAEKFYIKNSSFEVSRKRSFLMFGIETGFGDTSKGVKLTLPSLNEGWDITKMPGMVESLRAGSYNRGHQTALGGESVKYFYRIFQNTRVLEDDCGTTGGIYWTITEQNFRNFAGLYYVTSSGKTEPIPVSQERYDNAIIGKTIKVRSPMLCRTKAPSFCARCVGDALAANKTGLHIAVSDVGSTFMYAFMKKMHGVALKTAKYNPRLAIT